MTMTSASDDDVDNDLFDYVASANSANGKTSSSIAITQPRKTVYEMEREARIHAIVKEKGLSLSSPPRESAATSVLQPIHTSEVVVQLEGFRPAVNSGVNPSPSVGVAGTNPCFEVPHERGSLKTSASTSSAVEEAQRLRDQRYAIYRRNKALNQSALREVDPDTKRYVQISYAPTDGVVRQYCGTGRGRGVGRNNYSANQRSGMSRGGRRPVGRGGGGGAVKRPRD
uniref:Uncharacterized protein TCIL3000_11_5700 n=1 Tax=Trypanosoma congolense (strain IL3000) TaxID=1068625 RepID=G0V0I5_TRYCI|nr:unnamed protein product [Trypanosoma congolense IL3000]